jgi:uracil-DNA glycosylase
MTTPFSGWAGLRSQPKILFIAEAWGEREAATKQPLVGAAGTELWNMLCEAGFQLPVHLPYEPGWPWSREDYMCQEGLAYTNVFNFRPPDNNLEHICGPKTGLTLNYKSSLTKGKYLLAQYEPELNRLSQEINQSQPTLIVALGNAASWAILNQTKISDIRGVVTTCPWNIKVLPTFHPSAILHQWKMRPTAVIDLAKAKIECEFAEIRRPKRQVIINPSLAELDAWADNIIIPGEGMLSCDIETAYGQIKCIGFADSPDNAIVVPFMDASHSTGSYWPTLSDELHAWRTVRALLECRICKVFQNGVFDLQYISKMGIYPVNCTEDTMIFHHSLFPEVRKSLGFLGSVYTSEASWKLMRKQDNTKRDE